MRLEFDEKNPPPGGGSLFGLRTPPPKNNPNFFMKFASLQGSSLGNHPERKHSGGGGGGSVNKLVIGMETRIGDENVRHTATHSSKELQADNTTPTNKRSSRTGIKRRREESLFLVIFLVVVYFLVVYLQLLFRINQNRARCVSSIDSSRCFPLVVSS